MSHLYEISFANDDDINDWFREYKFYANNKMEAFMQFILDKSILRDSSDFIFNQKKLMNEYYCIDSSKWDDSIIWPTYNKIIVNWDIDKIPWKNPDDTEFMKIIRNKKSFISEFNKRDPKFLIKIYMKKWTHIVITELNPKFKVTYLYIKRITYKIQNTDYKHIIRLF